MILQKVWALILVLLTPSEIALVNYGSSNPFEDLVNDWKKAVKNFESKVSSAEKELEKAKKELKKATETRNLVKSSKKITKVDLTKATKELKKYEGIYKDIKKAVGSLESKADGFEKEVLALQQSLQEYVDKLMSQEIVAYRVNMPVKLDFNLATNSYYVDIQLAEGLNYDTKKVEAILAGQVQAPSINVLELAASAIGFRTSIKSDYIEHRNKLHKKYGAGNVYIASERFVNWAGPERLAEAGIKSLIGLSKDVLQDSKAMLELEYQDMVAWFKGQGQLNPELLAVKMLEAVLQGKSPSFGSNDIKAEISDLTYTYTAEQTGLSKIPQVMILKKAGVDIPKAKVSQPIPHLCFAIVVKREVIDSPAVDNAKRLLMSSETLNVDDLITAVSKYGGEKLGEVLNLVGGVSAAENELKQSISRTLRKELGMSEKEMEGLFTSQDVIIDLKESAIGERLEKLLKEKVALGNRKSAAIESFELDLASMRLIARLQVTHEHSWGTLAEASREVSKALGGARVSVEEFFDESAIKAKKDLEKNVSKLKESIDDVRKDIAAETKKVEDTLDNITDTKKFEANLRTKYSNISKELAAAEKKYRNAFGSVMNAEKIVRNARKELRKAEGEYKKALKQFDNWVPDIKIPKSIPNPFS